MSCLTLHGVTGRMTEKRRIGRDLLESSRDLIKDLSRYFVGGTEENH